MRTRARVVPMLGAIVAAYLAELAMRAKPSTLKAARSALGLVLRDLGDVPAASLDRLALEAWRRSRAAQGRSNRTINRDLTTLGAALAFACDRGLIAENPVRKLKRLPQGGRHRRRIARASSDDEIRSLLSAGDKIDARKPKSFPRTPLLRVLFETGCRWYELVACQWGDVDLHAGTLTLRSENVKTGVERTIPLRDETLGAIMGLRAAFVRVRGDLPTQADRLFLRPRGTAWGRDTSGFHRFLHEAMRVAKIPKADSAGRILHVHSARKSFRDPLRPRRSPRAVHRAPRRD